MTKNIKKAVKQTYTAAVNSGSGCGCGPSCCAPEQSTSFLNDNYENVEGYQEIADYGLGCGLPTEIADIKNGNSVLDLGSGAGNDVFIARNQVGETGKVIGIDFTEAMVEKANENKSKLGFQNVEFILGDIEELPVASQTIDVVISNCVMNLVPDKNKAYQEVFRVLKSGGHFSISDVVLNADLPKGILDAAEMYAGCVSGALEKTEYLTVIENAGFQNLEIRKEHEINLPDGLLLQFISNNELAAYRKKKSAIISITINAEKP
ncbi:MAG: arsenite methyltransferase [Lutibacter sp.]|nr:arsenite methyltransferase [Lutibacter sp.]MDT8417386.1 arsenite methyltransferase [Lutibacter sp.]